MSASNEHGKEETEVMNTGGMLTKKGLVLGLQSQDKVVLLCSGPTYLLQGGELLHSKGV